MRPDRALPPQPPTALTCPTRDCCCRCRCPRGHLLRWWRRRVIFLTLPCPICLRFSPRHCLLFCRSRPSCPAGCCVASLHAATSPASASCCAVASCSSALAPLVRLVVASILLTPPCPICRLHRLEGWARAADHLGLAPFPLAAPLPLVLLLLRFLSGWLLCHLSSCRHIPCQCLRLSSRHRLLFLRSCDSCLAGCCVAIHPVRQPQLHRHRGAARARPEPIAGCRPLSTTLCTTPPCPCPCPTRQWRKQAPPLWVGHRIRRTGPTLLPPYHTQRRCWQHHCR